MVSDNADETGDYAGRGAPECQVIPMEWPRRRMLKRKGALLLWALLGLASMGRAQHPDPTATHQDCMICHASHHAVPGSVPLERSTNDADCIACHVAPGSGLIPTTTTTTTTAAAKVAASMTANLVVKTFLAGNESTPLKAIPVPPGGSTHGQRGPGATGAKYVRVVGNGFKRTKLITGCTACHDPHGKSPGKLKALAFDARGNLLSGVKPTTVAQICYGCHAGPEAAPLLNANADLGQLFSQGTQSSHVIGSQVSDRPDLPSLRSGTFKDRLDCTSCHTNPDSAGLRGPHVSRFPSLLDAAFGHEKDAGFLGRRTNDLCYTCHDQRSIESNRSFPLHREHIYGFTGSQPTTSLPLGVRPVPLLKLGRPLAPFPGFGEPTPCATCHDPHGSRKYPSLISFDTTVVTRSSVGGVDFYRSGLGHGTCTLSCHTYDHVQTRY